MKTSKLMSCLRPDLFLKRSRNVRRFSQASFSQVNVNELEKIVGAENVITSESGLQQYGKDESACKAHLPNVAVKPHTTEQVSAIAKLCHRNRIPIIPFGIGTGVEGGAIPVRGGVSIVLTEMNNVLSVHPEDFDVCVEPGVTRKVLNTFIRDTGLWFPIDPGADATLGGMASTSASGTNAVRYGTMRENVLNLEVVLPDGTVIDTAGKGTRAKKTSAGYNLTNLFVGSEGTLGIITKVSLRLYATPEMIMSAVCSFPTIKDAVTTAIQTLQSNVPIARVELLDALSMKACNRFNKLNYKENPTLFLEFQGSKTGVAEQVNIVAELASSNGGEEFVWTGNSEERNKLWLARSSLYYAVHALRPGSKSINGDVCVPISKLPEVIVETQKDIEREGIIGAILGHVGDGNFHAVMLFDPANAEEKNKIDRIVERMTKRSWLSNGTCTGEHGIGLGKRLLLEKEIGPNGLEVMKKIKRTLDPLDIMNPDKVLFI